MGAKLPDDEETDNEAEELNKKALQRSQQMQTALRVTADLWKRDADPWPQTSKHVEAGCWAPSGSRPSTERLHTRIPSRAPRSAGHELLPLPLQVLLLHAPLLHFLLFSFSYSTILLLCYI